LKNRRLEFDQREDYSFRREGWSGGGMGKLL